MNVMFTTAQAEGAIPNGTIVEKTKSEDGDTHGDGARAKVLGSIGPVHDAGLPDPYAYFVEWLDLPGVPVGIGGHRIRVMGEADGRLPHHA